jgi:hypothetical protein
MLNKIILYYQTFIGLKNIYNNKNNFVTHIHLSSIHFGNNNNKSYIHLNNNNPYDKIYDNVWNDLIECKKKGITNILMVGGAGGAFDYMFTNDNTYNDCLQLLLELINNKKFDGVDLDIEEFVGLDNVLKLIRDLDKKLPKEFLITMAPVSDYLMDNSNGMGGFKYTDILKSDIGNRISYLNGQFYDSDNSLFSSVSDIYNDCLTYIPRDLLVIGVENVDNDYYNELEKIIKSGKISGVFFWEYNQIPDDFIEKVYNIMNKNEFELSCNIN